MIVLIKVCNCQDMQRFNRPYMEFENLSQLQAKNNHFYVMQKLLSI